jgi:hypothetical protein
MAFALRYAVGKNGWAAGPYWLDPGVIVDTTLRPDEVFKRPPPDAVPLNQETYDFMTSNGVIGMGYRYEVVAVVAGVVGILAARASGLSGWGLSGV